MKFCDIIGQEKVKSRLRDMVDGDRLPHALLLHGPAGVGALAMGRALAQYVHCRNHVDGDSCGVCPACLQHQSLNNADMYFVYPIVKKKSEGLILSGDYAPEWREFIERGPYASWEDWIESSKAGNSPERLQSEAANKLLKIIEEPFADTLFILVSNDVSAILPTIYSRTQRVELPLLGINEIASALERDYGMDSTAAYSVAVRSEGSMTTAIALTGTEGEHAGFARLFREMMRRAYSRDVKKLRETADEIAGMGREKSRRYLAYCCDMVRENFVYNMRVASLLNMDREEMDFSYRFAPYINAANAERMLDLFGTASADIARNASAKIVMFDTLLQLIVLILTKPES